MVTANPELERARHSLLSYYQQWQTLTETEGNAIRSGDWTQVEQLQVTKRQLQKFIVAATRALRAEAESSGTSLSGIEREFCGLVDQLIHLETRNCEEIATRRRQADADLALVEASRHHLRQVQRAYAPGREAIWQSYS
jgi:hypothetical protein